MFSKIWKKLRSNCQCFSTKETSPWMGSFFWQDCDNKRRSLVQMCDFGGAREGGRPLPQKYKHYLLTQEEIQEIEGLYPDLGV